MEGAGAGAAGWNRLGKLKEVGMGNTSCCDSGVLDACSSASGAGDGFGTGADAGEEAGVAGAGSVGIMLGTMPLVESAAGNSDNTFVQHHVPG